MNSFKVDNQPKIDTGFKTPDGYFDTLTEKITTTIAKDNVRVIPLWKRGSVIYAAAAALVLALILPFFNDWENDAPPVDQSTIENYLALHSGINQYDLITLLDSESISQVTSEMVVDEEILESTLSASGNLEVYVTE